MACLAWSHNTPRHAVARHRPGGRFLRLRKHCSVVKILYLGIQWLPNIPLGLQSGWAAMPRLTTLRVLVIHTEFKGNAIQSKYEE